MAAAPSTASSHIRPWQVLQRKISCLQQDIQAFTMLFCQCRGYTSLILVPGLLGAAFIWSVGTDLVSTAWNLGSLRPISRARDSTFLPLFNSTTPSWLPSPVAFSTNRGGRACHKNKLAEHVRASAKEREKFSEESLAANILCRYLVGWHSGLSLSRTLRLQVLWSFVEALSMLRDLEVTMKGLKLQQHTLKRKAWPHSPLGAIEGYMSRST